MISQFTLGYEACGDCLWAHHERCVGCSCSCTRQKQIRGIRNWKKR